MAKASSNRTKPAIAGKLGFPPNHKSTYGVGDGADGKSVPAGGGGNNKTPQIANKLTMPPSYDNYSK